MPTVVMVASALVLVVGLAVIFSRTPIWAANYLSKKAVESTSDSGTNQSVISLGQVSAIAAASLAAYSLLMMVLVPMVFRLL